MPIHPVNTSAFESTDPARHSADPWVLRDQLDEACVALQEGRVLRVVAYNLQLEFFEASMQENGLTEAEQVVAQRVLDQANWSGIDNDPFEHLSLRAREVISSVRDDELNSNPRRLGLAVFMDDEQGACLFFGRRDGCMALAARQDLERLFPCEVNVQPSPPGNPFNALLNNTFSPAQPRNAITPEEGIALSNAFGGMHLGADDWQWIESEGRDQVLAALDSLGSSLNESRSGYELEALETYETFFREQNPTRFTRLDQSFEQKLELLEERKNDMTDQVYRVEIDQLAREREQAQIAVFKALVNEHFDGVEISHL